MLNSFNMWLDDEVQSLHSEYNGSMYESGRHSEAVRIRAEFQQKLMEESISEVVEEICDHYCRFPEAYPERENQRMVEEKCNNCPLVRLMR